MLLGQDAAKIDAKKRAPENAREYHQIDYYEGTHIQHHYIKLRYFELSKAYRHREGLLRIQCKVQSTSQPNQGAGQFTASYFSTAIRNAKPSLASKSTRRFSSERRA